MSLTRRILFGAAASWFSRGVTIVLGLVLLPVLFRTLPKEELGIWLLLGQSWATLGILDFGFGVTLTRQIAFAKGKSGFDPAGQLNEISLSEIADALTTGRRIYRVLAVLSFIISFALGALYLQSLGLEQAPVFTVWTAWAMLCLSFALNTWATPWGCLLQGVGYVGWDAILISFVTALTLIGQIVAALLGGGLISLAVVATLGSLAQRFVFFMFALQKRPELFRICGRWRLQVFHDMIPLAIRAWLTATGAAMILYTDQFIIASFQGTVELPAYRAAWILVHNVTILSVTLASASGVFISHLWQAENLPQIHRILERNTRLGWLIMLAAAAVLLFAGQDLFTLWIGSGNFVGYGVLLVFLFTETLEMQNYIISSTSRATGDEAFAIASLGAGFIKIAISLYLLQHLGLLGVALGTTVALILTNHWYIPWRGLQRLAYSKRAYAMKVTLPCFTFFCLLAGLLGAASHWTKSSSSVVHLSVVILIAGVSLASSVWLMVLDSSERSQLTNRIQWPLP